VKLVDSGAIIVIVNVPVTFGLNVVTNRINSVKLKTARTKRNWPLPPVLSSSAMRLIVGKAGLKLPAYI
jgi:hypothetical protein